MILRRLGVPRAVVALIVALVTGGIGYMTAGRAPSGGPSAGGSASAGKAGTYMLQGRVVNVADGDTITLQTATGERRIRLASIDAPEIGHGQVKPGQPFGQASRQSLEGLVAGKTLQATCYEKDQYARDVCDLPGEGDHTANWQQVAAGFAWANTVRHGEYLRDPSLPDVQRRARDKKLGLWADAGAVAPWQWRYDCWNQRNCNTR
jgi:endonuclease YncB( thermonuclease family)